MESAPVPRPDVPPGVGCGNSSGADRHWAHSNRALRLWIAARPEVFAEAAMAAGSIRRRLKTLFPVLDDLTRATCPWCPEPCCTVNLVWFDFRDLLFLHLTRTPIPPGPLKGEEKEPCRYLAAHGCVLSRLQRPWACTQYLCGTQRRYMVKMEGKSALKALDEAIHSIAAERMALEDAVCQAVGVQGDTGSRVSAPRGVKKNR